MNHQQSWDNCEEWYCIQIEEKEHEFLRPMLEFVREIRALGYAEVFHLHRFGIHPNFSRSPIDTDALMVIRLEATDNISIKMHLNDKTFLLEHVKLEMSPEIRSLLELLAAHIAELEQA